MDRIRSNSYTHRHTHLRDNRLEYVYESMVPFNIDSPDMQDEGGDVYGDKREKQCTVGCRGFDDIHD